MQTKIHLGSARPSMGVLCKECLGISQLRVEHRHKAVLYGVCVGKLLLIFLYCSVASYFQNRIVTCPE